MIGKYIGKGMIGLALLAGCTHVPEKPEVTTSLPGNPGPQPPNPTSEAVAPVIASVALRSQGVPALPPQPPQPPQPKLPAALPEAVAVRVSAASAPESGRADWVLPAAS